jgi:hypothetical protein
VTHCVALHLSCILLLLLLLLLCDRLQVESHRLEQLQAACDELLATVPVPQALLDAAVTAVARHQELRSQQQQLSEPPGMLCCVSVLCLSTLIVLFVYAHGSCKQL